MNNEDNTEKIYFSNPNVGRYVFAKAVVKFLKLIDEDGWIVRDENEQQVQLFFNALFERSKKPYEDAIECCERILLVKKWVEDLKKKNAFEVLSTMIGYLNGNFNSQVWMKDVLSMRRNMRSDYLEGAKILSLGYINYFLNPDNALLEIVDSELSELSQGYLQKVFHSAVVNIKFLEA
jgi:hypothetical protein